MNIFTLFSVLWIWIIRDSVICMPQWMYPYQNVEYSKNLNNDFIISDPRNLGSDWNQWSPGLSPREYVYEETRTPYYPFVDLQPFFIPRVQISPVSLQGPVHYILPNEWIPPQQYKYNYPETVTKVTTSRSTRTRIASTAVPRKTSTSSKLEHNDGPGGIFESTSDSGRRYDRNISNSTKSSARLEISTRRNFVKQNKIAKAKRNNTNLDIFKNRIETTSQFDDKIKLQLSTLRKILKFRSSTPNIFYTSPKSSSPSTIESIDSRILNFEANDTDVSFSEEPTTEAIFTRNSTESFEIPVRSTSENKLENRTFKIDDVGFLTTQLSLVSSNTSGTEISMKNSTVDSTTESGSFETISPVLEPPVEAEIVGLKSLKSNTILSETTKTPEEIVTENTTPVNLYNLTSNFLIIGNEGRDQTTIDVLPNSSTIIQSLSPEMETDNTRKLTVDSDVSKTVEQSEQFSDLTITTTNAILSNKTDEFLLETTSISTDNQSVVENLQFSTIFFSQNNATDSVLEMNDGIESTTYESYPVSYTDTIASDSEVTVDDSIKFTCEYDPNETSTDYGFDLMEATSPQNIVNSNLSTSTFNSSEIKHGVKRQEITVELKTTKLPIETVYVEIAKFTNLAKDSSSKLDIDSNDREEYIFNVTASRSHISKGL